MLFFNKTFICYLNSSSFEIFANNSSYKFPFTPELIQYSELVDENKFTEAFLQFIDKLNLNKLSSVIFLSPKIVFTSELNVESKDESESVKTFLTSVPFVQNNITNFIVKNNNKSTIYATNRKLYEIVTKLFKGKNIEIYSVTPISVFLNISENQDLTYQDLKNATKQKKVLKQYNFLQNKHKVGYNNTKNSEEFHHNEKINKNTSMQYIMLILSLFLLGGSILYLLIWSGVISYPQYKNSAKIPSRAIVPASTSLVTTKPSPTIKPLDKSSIKIQILNGSGISGQAGKLSLILQNEGYKNITTNNASNSGELTNMLYFRNIPVSNAKEIADSLKEELLNIAMQETTRSAEFDVIITTGIR